MSVLSPSQIDRRPSVTARRATPGAEPRTESHVAARRPTPKLARFARRLVLPRLEGITGGQLEVSDADGTHHFGDANGGPAHELTVVDPRFYSFVARSGSLGAGDAYVRGYWKSDDLVGLLRLMSRNMATIGGVERPWSRAVQTIARWAADLTPNTRRASRRHIAAHYDLSNEFFALFLDPTMTYSSGVFESPNATLEQASLAKYESIARKLRLTAGDRVVEIGCGWGGFAEFAAARFGCHVTGVTISPTQFDYARRRIAAAGLADRVDLRLCDYRDLAGRFDKLVSIEMVEAVGHAQLPTFFGKCSLLLTDEGLMALQAITIPDQRYARYRRGVDFIQKYIFPGGRLPSLGALGAAIARASDFRIVHLEDFAEHYARTLIAWREAFFAAEEQIAELGFGPEFRRTWDYYFSSCAAGFYERLIGVSQIVLAKRLARGEPGSPGGCE